MNKSEYQIVSIPDKFIIDKNAIYEFGIGLSNENALITDNEIRVQLVLKEQLDKYKNVFDKIKEYCKEEKDDLIAGGEVCEDILELLEEVE